MKKYKDIISIIGIVLGVILIRSFIVTPVIVNGTSMYPTLDDSEMLLLKKYDHSYDRFDIIVFNYNNDYLVKRIIGLPGENVKYIDNELYINGEKIKDVELDTKTKDFTLNELGYETIPENYYFVLGDNRNNSTDSRIIGLVNENDIIGITNFSLLPIKSFGKIDK